MISLSISGGFGSFFRGFWFLFWLPIGFLVSAFLFIGSYHSFPFLLGFLDFILASYRVFGFSFPFYWVVSLLLLFRSFPFPLMSFN